MRSTCPWWREASKGNSAVSAPAVFGALLTAITLCAGCGATVEVVAPTSEPLVPTLAPGTTTLGPDASDVSSALALPSVPSSGRERFGVGVPGAAGSVSDYAIEWLDIGWYLNWRVEVDPYRPGGVAFWQMVRVSKEGYRPDEETIRSAVAANRGAVWLIGNEPDVRWQDNVTPERYAEIYHELYHALKSLDLTCTVAIGGVSQPTPLRLAYLDRILAAYQAEYGEPMPVDMWNVHGFILREERDSWGVDIPPGIAADQGLLYEIDDHDDMAIFCEQLLSFRQWMAGHGYRDRPLVVSEYGVLMPADYGFGVDRVQAFMYATFDHFLTARDQQVGYPQDNDRLVQYWAWYSLADTAYPTGNLFDPQSGSVTVLGVAHAIYKLPGGVPDP
jgi:hypothetical protein